MAKQPSRSESPIEKLLQERSQYVTWLQRLDSSSDAVPTVPEAVRFKVRADYQTRLDAVVEALRTHATSIEEQLEEFRARRFELSNRESQAKEAMSEAEVRHAVGEFDEGRWQNIRGETARILVAVREELGKTNAEIDRLTEVQQLISAPAAKAEEPPEPEFIEMLAPKAPAPAPSPPRAVETPAPKPPAVPIMPLDVEPASAGLAPTTRPVLEPVTPAAAPPDPRPAAAKTPTPKPPAAKPREEPPAKTLWFPSGNKAPGGDGGKLDEMAFLKSVTGQEATPAPKRASGSYAKAAEPAPPPGSTTTTQPSVPTITTADPLTPKPAPRAPEADRGTGSTGAKTLKCGECGTMNRPTEWYCERCGAELAAL